MIVFDLKCSAGHIFEAWFGSGAAFDTQSEAGQVHCPLCGDTHVAKAAMAPNVAAKGNTARTPAAAKAAMQAIAAAQAGMLAKSEWVGPAFARRARAMHAGEEKQAVIHGQASAADVKALVADGVPVAPLPLPVVPPKALN